MIDVRTGKPFAGPSARETLAGMTRRTFGKGIAACLAAGCAPSIVDAATGLRRGVAMRAGMMAGSGGGGVVPYDAQLQYLKGTGTQYIDTGVLLSKYLEVTTTFDVTDTSGLCWFFGAEEWSEKNSMSAYSVGSGKYAIIFAGSSHYTTGSLYGTHTAKVNNSGIWLDGSKKKSIYSLSLTWTGNMLLFTANRGGTPNLAETSNMRIIRHTISESGVTLVDLIPVRKDGIGYMYDQAHPTGGPFGNGLYANAGTGSFTLGPDVN